MESAQQLQTKRDEELVALYHSIMVLVRQIKETKTKVDRGVLLDKFEERTKVYCQTLAALFRQLDALIPEDMPPGTDWAASNATWSEFLDDEVKRM